jgi:DNA-3-methyladenine glycosylase II
LKWLHNSFSALSEIDPHLSRALESVGAPRLKLRPHGFETLLRLIVEQQVSVKAAASIWKRVCDAMDNDVTPDNLLALEVDDLRACGLSGQKTKYGIDLARHVQDGRLDLVRLKKLDDEEVTTHLTQVKGIGRWTAENYMIFSLARPDIWPAGDIALMEGVRKIKNMRERPDEKKIRKLAEKWRPHRTAAALLIWRFKEGANGYPD